MADYIQNRFNVIYADRFTVNTKVKIKDRFSMSEVVQDQLKRLEEIYYPDERQEYFQNTLEDLHSKLRGIILSDAVPLDVRQLFETAKNISLYSWFVYRFNQVAELVSFSAVEMALRIRYLRENPTVPESKESPPTLFRLMQHAKSERWITNGGFSGMYELARDHAECIKMMEKATTHDFDLEPSMLIDDPSEDEIQDALNNLDRVSAVAENINKSRNNLAHGSSTLHPDSISTLRINADIINQVYQ